MNTQSSINFERIKLAIEYIAKNYKEQPNLDKVAEYVNLSPYYFQRMFTEWAGVSPKRFLQFISVKHAKALLKQSKNSLFDTADAVGLSGTSRLHDHFISIEAMTPGEYKNGGESLTINYSFSESLFGNIIIASTSKGVCYIAFAEDNTEALRNLQDIYPNAEYNCSVDSIQQDALTIFTQNWIEPNEIKLHIKGTNFQLKVWEALLSIPVGGLTSYGHIATSIESPKASRAVGTAVGENPIAFLIPCHRVIQSTGLLGQYHWGTSRKAVMIGWEAGHIDE